MSVENKSEVAAVVEHCSPVMDLERGALQAVHQSYKILDAEKYQDGRNRIRGSFATPIFADFAQYIGTSPTTGPVPLS